MAHTATVKGILKDRQGKPLPDAVVMVAGGTGSFSDMAAVTNDSGEFYLSNITLPGNYTLQIQLNGTSVQKQVQVASAADIIVLTY